MDLEVSQGIVFGLLVFFIEIANSKNQFGAIEAIFIDKIHITK